MESLYRYFPLRKRSCNLTHGKLLKDITNVDISKRRKTHDVIKPCAASLNDQPVEILWNIFKHLTWPDLCLLAQSSRYMTTVVAEFISSKHLEDQIANDVNARFVDDVKVNLERDKLLFKLLDTCHEVRKGKFVTFIKCLDRIAAKRMVFSMPVFLQICLNNWGTTVFLRFLESLVCHWFGDVVEYVGVSSARAFPMRLGVGNKNDVKLESDIRDRFLTNMFDPIHQNELTRSCILSVFLKMPQLMPMYREPSDDDIANGLNLHPIRHAHKLMYCIFGPRFEYVDYFSLEHSSQSDPSYGQFSEAFSLLLRSPDAYWTDPNIFTVLEDLTTNPELWSMQSFISFIIHDVTLCMLTIAVRYRKGYYNDAATIFYYCARQATRSFVFELSRRLMEFFQPEEIVLFQLHVGHKSKSVLNEAKGDCARVRVLTVYHRLIVDSLTYGRNCLLVRQKLRASSV